MRDCSVRHGLVEMQIFVAGSEVDEKPSRGLEEIHLDSRRGSESCEMKGLWS